MNIFKTVLIVAVVLFVGRGIVNTAKADDMFGNPSVFDFADNDTSSNSIWKSDGSLVIINGAEDSGYVVKGGDGGDPEIEYYVKPKANGDPTFIYDDELIICTNTGCY